MNRYTVLFCLLLLTAGWMSWQAKSERQKKIETVIEAHEHGFYDGYMEAYGLMTGSVGVPSFWDHWCETESMNYREMVKEQAEEEYGYEGR